MTKWNRTGRMRLVAALICVICAFGGVSGSWAAGITDALDDEGGIYLYSVEFGETGFTVMIPLPYTKSYWARQEEAFNQLVVFTDAESAEPFFVLTALKSEALLFPIGMPEIEADLPAVAFMPILYAILGEFDWMQMHGEYTEEFGEDVPAMRITLAEDDELGRHIIGIRDDWAMVLTLFPGTEELSLDGLDEYADVLFNYMMVPYGFLPTVEIIELPGSTLVLELPEGLRAVVDRYDEYTDREMVIYHISSSSPDDKRMLLTLTTVRKEIFQGKLLHEMQEQELHETVSDFLLGLGEVEAEWLLADSGYPLLQLREVGHGSGEQKNPDLYHLIVMKDGWLLDLWVIDLDVRPIEELRAMQLDFMTRMLAGDGEAPAVEP